MPPRRRTRFLRNGGTVYPGSFEEPPRRAPYRALGKLGRNERTARSERRFLDVAQLARDLASGREGGARELLAPRAQDVLLRAPDADRGHDALRSIAHRRRHSANPEAKLPAIHRVSTLARFLEVTLDVAPAGHGERREALDVLHRLVERIRRQPSEDRLARGRRRGRHARADARHGLEGLRA